MHSYLVPLSELSRIRLNIDHGPNHMSMVYASRVAELGAIPSTGTVGDSYDNSMAEAINALYKAELVRQKVTKL